MSIWEYLGGFTMILIGSGLGSLLFDHLFLKVRNKTEREFLLKKEELFRLQKKAEEIYRFIHRYKNLIDLYMLFAKNKIFDETKVTELHTKKVLEDCQEKMTIVMNLYFSDILSSYMPYHKAIGDFFDAVFLCYKKETIDLNDAKLINNHYNEIHKMANAFSTAILDEIKRYREKIITF